MGCGCSPVCVRILNPDYSVTTISIHRQKDDLFARRVYAFVLARLELYVPLEFCVRFTIVDGNLIIPPFLGTDTIGTAHQVCVGSMMFPTSNLKISAVLNLRILQFILIKLRVFWICDRL